MRLAAPDALVQLFQLHLLRIRPGVLVDLLAVLREVATSPEDAMEAGQTGVEALVEDVQDTLRAAAVQQEALAHLAELRAAGEEPRGLLQLALPGRQAHLKRRAPIWIDLNYDIV